MIQNFESKIPEFELLCKEKKTDIEDFTDLYYLYEDYKKYKKQFIAARKRYNVKFKDFKFLRDKIRSYAPLQTLEILSYGIHGKSKIEF